MGKITSASNLLGGIYPIPLLVNAKYIAAQSLNMVATTTDVYTVPTGKRALILGAYLANQGANNPNIQVKYKIGGSYYRATATSLISSGTVTTVAHTIVLEAGESISITTDASGISYWVRGVEYDANVALYSPRLVSLSSGNNTLYTVPSGKTAYVWANNTPGTTGQVFFGNDSGGTRTISYNQIPSGGSVSTDNQVTAAISAGNASLNTQGVISSMGAGDFININTNAATATQMCWTVVAEI